ncbi:MAG: DUF3375 domain-containing protein [Pirellulaceae bacterium]|nr:DUF3375 domain-containing protein [Pirellulaceae bacterium]
MSTEPNTLNTNQVIVEEPAIETNEVTWFAEPTLLDRLLAAPMFVLLFGYLLCVRGAILWLEQLEGAPLPILFTYMGLVHIIIFLELVLLHTMPNSQTCWRDWLMVLIPPLRLCGRGHSTPPPLEKGLHVKEKIKVLHFVWLPITKWQKPSRELADAVAKRFSFPMIFIAILILPVLGAEFYWNETVESSPILKQWVMFGTLVIWVAFALEFLIMISVVPKKITYCIEHWLDLAIIVLPLLSFLRIFQAARLMRLYRLRGMAIKAYRAILLLEAIEKILSINPERRIAKLKQQIEEKEYEINDLRQMIIRVEDHTKKRERKRVAKEERKRRQREAHEKESRH